MDKLYQASYWSKGFYAYFYAACLDMEASINMNLSVSERKEIKGFMIIQFDYF